MMQKLRRAMWAMLLLGACGTETGLNSEAAPNEDDPGREDASLPRDAAVDSRAPSADASIPDADASPRDAAVDAPKDANPPKPLDVTFYVVSDTHADPPADSYDLRATARAVNAVGRGGTWPATIAGRATGFRGGAIAEPRGVVLTGDITGWGTAPTEIQTFRRYFEAGASGDAIRYPAYVGLGNHDVDSADRPEPLASTYRALYWAHVDGRHRGPNAPVKVTSFDDASHNYSWDFDKVHLVQTHRFPGDTGYGLASSRAFLAADLRKYANDGRPVFVFHHYGLDAFGTEDRWWTAADRTAYRDIIRGYNVAGIIAGHSHFAMQYDWDGLHVFQVNNAKAEINTGNRDGNGSFAIVRVVGTRLDIVTCRWLDDTGRYELIEPFYSGAVSVP